MDHVVYPSITAARAVQVNPIAIPIHGVWPREPSLRAWRTCRAPSLPTIVSGSMERTGSRGARSGIDGAERIDRSVLSRARGDGPARTAGARATRKTAGLIVYSIECVECLLLSSHARGK